MAGNKAGKIIPNNVLEFGKRESRFILAYIKLNASGFFSQGLRTRKGEK
jgi:hypothetical protein